MSLKSIKFKVYGIVQGVNFRYYTQVEASKLGLRGFIRNNIDSSVEGVAQGSSSQLEKFKQYLAQGPPAARVQDIKILEESEIDQPNFPDFSVERTSRSQIVE